MMTKEEAYCYLDLWLIALNEGLGSDECYNLAITLIDQYFYEDWKESYYYKEYKQQLNARRQDSPEEAQ